MHNIYIDEKGPQNQLRVNTNEINNIKDRFRIADDNMLTYVMAAIDIPYKNQDHFEKEFIKLEALFISNMHNSTVELKGAKLLDRKKFVNGFASLPKSETQYFIDIIELFNKHNISACVVTEDKVSALVMGRLKYWIEFASKKMKISSQLLAYSLIKYVAIESTSKVNNELSNSNVKIYSILKSIKKDLQSIIEKNKNVSRMRKEISNYKEIITVINKCQNVNVNDPKGNSKFNWEKVDFSLDLWLTERNYKDELSEYSLFLDEGIEPKYFNEKNYSSVVANQDSRTSVGIRSADLLVTLVGKLISNLSSSSQYDKNFPEKKVRLNDKWFDLQDNQLKLAKLLNNLIINTGFQYSFTNSDYFDDAILCQSYLEYLSKFANSDALKNTQNHPEKYFEHFSELMEAKYNQMYELDNIIINSKISRDDLVTNGLLKPR
ncbi:hypothetical protein [Latilactobacillus fragifolii]|uniref:hypothetical protein n=1 Tax=Latilactobacillus fragifolii TaxID=2814244 RepID=UPI001ABAE3E7|nr:hypothetical protein [Latilactobacillus fragifolii]